MSFYSIIISSEVTTSTGNTAISIRSIRRNVAAFNKVESVFKEYLHSCVSSSEYVEELIQKIYHPTKEDLSKSEVIELADLK